MDATARICPFCNWDQTAAPPANPQASQAGNYVPPPDTQVRRKVFGLAAGAALIMAAFVVGALIHGFEPSEVKAAQARQGAAPAASPRATVKLVPVTDGSMASAFDETVTTVPPSAPAQPGATTTAAPSDATALPSAQYAAAAARARAAQEQAQEGPNVGIDPRRITGDLYRNPAGAARPRPAPRASHPTTEPVAIAQPIPHISVDRESTMRLFLTVGTDGRVHDVDVVQGIPGEMGRVISAVQDWRFRPATENGQPVTARFAVEITFRPE